MTTQDTWLLHRFYVRLGKTNKSCSTLTKEEEQNNPHIATPFAQTYFHGTKADLKTGDYIQAGFISNYEDRKLKHVYVAATLNTAVLGAKNNQKMKAKNDSRNDN